MKELDDKSPDIHQSLHGMTGWVLHPFAMSHPVDGSDQKELPLMHPQACELSPTHLMDAPFDVLWCFSHHGGIQNP